MITNDFLQELKTMKNNLLGRGCNHSATLLSMLEVIFQGNSAEACVLTLKDVASMKTEFEAICTYQQTKSVIAEEMLFLEKYKLALIALTLHHIKQPAPVLVDLPAPTNQIKATGFRRYCEYVLFSLIFTGGIIYDSIGHFVAALSIFTLVPFISAGVLVGIATAIALVNTIIFVAFDAKLLSNVLHINLLTTKYAKLEVLVEQIKKLKELNLTLLKTQRTDSTAVEQLVVLFNQDIRQKAATHTYYVEQPLTKTLRYFITVFGMITIIGGNYFFATNVITLLAAGLSGTPVGWAVAGVCAAIAVGLYFSKGANDLYSLLNPQAQPANNLKDKLVKFTNKNYLDNFTLNNDATAHKTHTTGVLKALFKENSQLKQQLQSQGKKNEDLPNKNVLSINHSYRHNGRNRSTSDPLSLASAQEPRIAPARRA